MVIRISPPDIVKDADHLKTQRRLVHPEHLLHPVADQKNLRIQNIREIRFRLRGDKRHVCIRYLFPLSGRCIRAALYDIADVGDDRRMQAALILANPEIFHDAPSFLLFMYRNGSAFILPCCFPLLLSGRLISSFAPSSGI